MIKVAVCDDEEIIRKETIRNCIEYEKQNKLKINYIEFSSGEEMLAYKSDIDILFLDIKLTGINGIEVMKRIENYDNISFVVFITAYDQYVWDSFSIKTLGYLVKPIEYTKFIVCFEKVLNEMNANPPIDIPIGNSKITIKSHSLQYIEAQGCYSLLVTNDNKYLVRSILKEWEEKLKDYNFIRIHNSYIVNLAYITVIDKTVLLKSGTTLKISRRKRIELLDIYRKYITKIAR